MRAVIFDMDGLMFDTERVFVAAWDYAGEKLGIGKAGYMVIKTLGASIAAARDVWQAEFGDAWDEQAMRLYSKDFIKQYYKQNTAPVKKGLLKLLVYLKEKGVQLAVASSSPGWEVEKHLTDTGVRRYFAAVICGDMVSKSKPDPEIYLKACEALRETPADCIALEDSKNGALSACGAGCKTILVPDLWQPDEDTRNRVLCVQPDLDAVQAYLCRSEKIIYN